MKPIISKLQRRVRWFVCTLSMRCCNTEIVPNGLQRMCLIVLTWMGVLATQASKGVDYYYSNPNYLQDNGIYYNVIDTAKLELEVINPIQYYNDRNAYGYRGLIVIPESVSIGGKSYRVVRIGNVAFKEDAVTKVVMPSSITSMGFSAFKDCHLLTSVTLSPNIETISTSAFFQCISLESINLPTAVKHIGSNAFYACKFAKPFEIPEGVETIGKQAFMCTNIPEVKLPASLKSIGDECFARCPYLTKVVVPSVDQWLRMKVGRNLFNTTFYDLYETNGNKVQHVTLPADMDSFPANAFVRCGSLTSATLHDKVKVVGANAFYKCWNMANCNLPESLRTIEPGAFMECRSTTDVVLPGKLETIGDSAFRGCTWLQHATFSNTPTAIGVDVFRDCSHLSQIALPDGLTNVPDGMFDGCSALTQVSKLNTVTSLGHRVFRGCASLWQLDVSSHLTSIGVSAFKGCKMLMNNLCFNKLTTLGDSAFYNCSRLTSVRFNAPFTTIGNCSFAYCSSLTDIKLPDSLQVMSERMFYQCASLEQITIPETVQRLKRQTLSGCFFLKNIYFYPWRYIYEYDGWIETGSSRTIYTYEIMPYNWLTSYGVVNKTIPIRRPTVIYVTPETLTMKDLNTKYKLKGMITVSTDSEMFEYFNSSLIKRWYEFLSDDESVLVVDNASQECYTMKNGVATLIIRVSDSSGFELTRGVKVYVGNGIPDAIDGVTTDGAADDAPVKRVVKGVPLIVKDGKAYTVSGTEVK